MAEYDQILSIMGDVGRVMELSPAARGLLRRSDRCAKSALTAMSAGLASGAQ